MHNKSTLHYFSLKPRLKCDIAVGYLDCDIQMEGVKIHTGTTSCVPGSHLTFNMDITQWYTLIGTQMVYHT